MIILNKLVLILPLIPPCCESSINKSDIKFYKQYTIEQKPNKNIIEYNTMTNEELIRENNEKIIQQIYKTLE